MTILITHNDPTVQIHKITYTAFAIIPIGFVDKAILYTSRNFIKLNLYITLFQYFIKYQVKT